MNSYKILNKQVFSNGKYAITPIRMKDRYAIMDWRNSQIKILRQKHTLTKEEQDKYFKEIVSELFDKEQPEQVLFSFLLKGKLIGYGGYVHIDWDNKNAEISFLLTPERNSDVAIYTKEFGIFLELIEEVGFELGLHKIYTYGYDIYDFRFQPIINQNYLLEATLKNHVFINEKLYAVRIYSKILKNEY